MSTIKAMACTLTKAKQEKSLGLMLDQFRKCPDVAFSKWSVDAAKDLRDTLGVSVALDFLMSAFRDEDCNLDHNTTTDLMGARMKQFLETVAFEMTEDDLVKRDDTEIPSLCLTLVGLALSLAALAISTCVIYLSWSG